ncbi:TolC family protein [Roseomonas sp. NAR14]|uniref:TolC family protein n=1 Tax=Roseomonas acroporae TaxID=2937791 RepID=A0A9X2BYC4_9PROT|nr:TolC family protein [Roseomonas acroporae]MCK8786824.1 TolC family protein [Roseomonas acroporae]
MSVTVPGLVPLPYAATIRPMTLEQAERLLVERNLTVLAARRGVDAARAQVLVNSSIPSPTFSFGNTAFNTNERVNGGLQGSRFFGPNNNFSTGLSMLVERGGKRELRTRFADEQIGVAETQVLDAMRTQLFGLRQAFLNALLARANLEVALSNRGSLDRTEALLRRQLANGAIPEGDLIRFQAGRLQFEQDVLTQAQSYAAGVAQVAVFLAADAAAFVPGAGQLDRLGIRPSVPGALALPANPVPRPGSRLAEQEARGEAPDAGGTPGAVGATPPAGRGAARGPAAPGGARGPVVAPMQPVAPVVLPPVAFDLRGRIDRAPELGVAREVLAEAVAQRPDVVVAARQASAAAANTRLAEAGRARDVTIGATWSRSRLSQDLPNSRLSDLYANNSLGLSFSIPLFTNRMVEGNVGVAAGQQGQAEAQARATLAQARADFAVAWAGYEQARLLLTRYGPGAIAQAEDSYAIVERSYFAGGNSLIDVLDALRTLNATRVAVNTVRINYLLALAQLEQATGVSGLAPRP